MSARRAAYEVVRRSFEEDAYADRIFPAEADRARLDESGEPVEVEAEGLEARVIQHELDHLDGVLIIDRAPKEDRRAALRELRLKA